MLNKIVMMITIINRNKSEELITYLIENNVQLVLGKYAKGTASSEMIDYLGINDKERCVIFSTMNYKLAKELLPKIEEKMELKKRGQGLAVLVPISSVAGAKTMEMLAGNIEEGDENILMEKTSNELLIIIANRGYVDQVMDAAREAGASGGTVMHARGTGKEHAEKFFGVTIGAEKEMIFIVTDKMQKIEIMNNIKKKAGINTDAQSFMFSVPVSDVAGLEIKE